ncbi:MAG: T9SS C-terminal target domain-containing protein [Haliscomenobacteraceae bacterium CHB4]|nr:hypothetical protein [Saprospiraceae bacterium]MCE7925751.1 T9SS C-terminal target domain-containing protein [Haliscomenobacteraceae bacterium CHB4]
MKKTVLLLCVVAWAATMNAQNCMRDSSLLMSGALVSPWYWSPDSPFIFTKTACINEPYTQSFTFNVPDTLALPNLPAIPITNISIATAGAITGLPAGLTYLCDPPNCVFAKNTLGCVLVYGTPTGPADTADLSILVNIPPFPFPLNFPSVINASFHYYLVVKPQGECVSGADDLSGQISSVKNTPNPFSDQTMIQVESNVSGDFRFEVFDLTGQMIHSQSINVLAGSNQFTFEAGDLPNGAYFFTFGNADGRVARKMVIAR